ncbi:LuxR C-terminal-related transcriptional regulator [Streptomyces sp. NPDC058525]|uniref:LuxR C-terminal-related transcriptional regulator n=1 Tax=Streptomyces sp. NPDC058525 TaxID=3346538 RepID=UPI0036634687
MSVQDSIVGRWPLAGRDSEIETFDQAWAGRRHRAVVIVGPAGVGKSRLAEEYLARAVRAGWSGGRATASAAAATIPLGAIAHLLPPEVDLSDPVKGFAVATRVLAGQAKRRARRALLIDDLHLLDAASAALLHGVVEASAARLIGTVRAGEPITDAVDALIGDDAALRIDLVEFAPHQVEEVLRAALGGPVGHRAVHQLHEASGGNVLYLRELVLGALRAKSLANDGEIWDLAKDWLVGTPRLAELIEARLAAVPRAVRPMLELLALCEPMALADAIAAAPAADTLATLENAGLVQIRQERRRLTITLTHPLYGEALRERISLLRRRSVLVEQAQRIEAHGSRRREDALNIATWRLAATGEADSVLLAQAAVLARHARDYGQVIALLDALPTGDHTPASLVLQGDSLLQTGQWQRADQILAEAELRADGGAEGVTATLIRTWNLFWMAACTEEALRVNEAARERIPPDAPELRRTLTVNEASLRTLSGEPARGLAILEGTEASAWDALDPNMWATAALSKAAGLMLGGRTEDAIAWAQHAYSRNLQIDQNALGAPPPASQLLPMVVALADAGRLEAAREISQQALSDLVAAQGPQPRVWALFLRGRVEWLAGDIAAARRWYAEAVAQARTYHQTRVLCHAFAGQAAAAATLGDLTAAEAALSEMREHPNMGLFAGEERLGEAWLHVAHGRLAQARDVLTEAAQAARETGHVTSEILLLTDLARLGAAGDAADRLADLAMTCDGAFAPARARLAHALSVDNPDDLLAVARELEAIGAFLLAAEAASAAGTAWRRHGQSRHVTAATTRAAAYAARCKGVRTPLLVMTGTSAPLSARERDVALLAAAGAPSKDIAAQLVLSVRTVDNHLQNIYSKLGVNTRRELSQAMREFGASLEALPSEPHQVHQR